MIPLEEREYQRYALVLAFFALGLYVALVVASLGMLSLFLNREVVAQTDAGPLVGPAMVGASALALLLCMWAGVGSARGAMRTVPVVFAVLAALLSYLFYGIGGGLFYGFGIGAEVAVPGEVTISSGAPGSEPVTGLIFWGEQLSSPFAFAAGAWAGVVAIVYFLLLIWRAHGGQRPRWPWEKHPQ